MTPDHGPAGSVARRAVTLVAGLAALIATGVLLRAATRGLAAWDRHAVVAVAGWRGTFVIDAARVASVFGRSWLLVGLAAILGWALRRGGRGLVPVVAVVLAIVTQNVVKEIARRPRPPVAHLEHVTSWSFPSGHATDSTALLAALVICLWPRLTAIRPRIAAVGLAAGAELLIAGARITLGVHYPTDVLAGIVLGTMAALIAVRVASDAQALPSSTPAVTISAPPRATCSRLTRSETDRNRLRISEIAISSNATTMPATTSAECTDPIRNGSE